MATNLPTPTPPAASRGHAYEQVLERFFGRTQLILLIVMAAVLTLCIVFTWTTRDAMSSLSFLKRGNSVAGQKSLVDTHPLQTAEALAPLAITSEEKEFAHEAERLADHDADQAFAAALRQASQKPPVMTPKAKELEQKVAQLAQQVKDDQTHLQSLTPSAPPATGAPATNDLDVAKAQLSLDQDELADAQQELARATGDQRSRIQQELAAHQADEAKSAAQQSGATTAVLNAAQYNTLAGRIRAWFKQNNRYQQIQQGRQQAQFDAASLTTQRNQLDTQTAAQTGAQSAASSGNNPQPDYTTRMAMIKARSAQRQLLAIYDDRIQTQQQLTSVYDKWSAQVLLQHRIVIHLILQSLIWIAALAICTILCDALVRHLMARPSLDRRRMHTLRTILRLAVQFVGGLLILLVIFGTPSQMPTILGFATAGLTVVMQDYIIAFFGWFVLMGKNGIRVGDWVEINSVGGEIIEISLFRTTMLETGNWTGNGHPTGRHISFINSFAIRGQYFNFSSSHQWMWDEITLTAPTSEEASTIAERIRQTVLTEIEQNTRLAAQDWQRTTHQYGLSQFGATPSVDLRPTGSGTEIIVRYVTRAAERFDTRNRIYLRMISALRTPEALPTSK
jgi:small-conductance mechanosensitive channel